jgi:hypothetical protein
MLFLEGKYARIYALIYASGNQALIQTILNSTQDVKYCLIVKEYSRNGNYESSQRENLK